MESRANRVPRFSFRRSGQLRQLADVLHALSRRNLDLSLRGAHAETNIGQAWSGVSRLRDLDYFGWVSRFPNCRPDDQSAAGKDAGTPTACARRWKATGRARCSWDLIARVYPSYPLPGIDADGLGTGGVGRPNATCCGKTRPRIGNTRIRADLTGSGRIEHPTGALRQLRETFLDHHRRIRANRARAAELDFLIDRIVFRLFYLTLDEQRLILSRVGPGRPLPPRRGRKRRQAGERVDRNLRLFDDG